MGDGAFGKGCSFDASEVGGFIQRIPKQRECSSSALERPEELFAGLREDYMGVAADGAVGSPAHEGNRAQKACAHPQCRHAGDEDPSVAPRVETQQPRSSNSLHPTWAL